MVLIAYWERGKYTKKYVTEYEILIRESRKGIEMERWYFRFGGQGKSL